jgi:hypothetical protein
MGTLGLDVGAAKEEEKEEEFLSESEKGIEEFKAQARRRERLVTTGSVVVAVGLFVGFLFQQGVVAAVMQGGGGRAQVKEEEEEEEGTVVGEPWQTVEPGVAELAAKMDFLGDLKFDSAPANGVV